MPDDELIPPEWSPDWDEQTAELAYEAAKDTRASLIAWGDSLDTKLVGVFAVGAVILTVAPALQPSGNNPALVACWIVAGILWLAALAFGFYGYRPSAFRLGPDPQILLDAKWLAKSPLEFRLWQVAVLADSFRRNHATLERKANALAWTLGLTAAEVLTLALASVLSRVCW